MSLTGGRTFKKQFTLVHTVSTDEANSGCVRLTIQPNVSSGVGLAYNYWTRTAGGVGRVTAYTSNFIQPSGILFVAGTFAANDIITSDCRLMFV